MTRPEPESAEARARAAQAAEWLAKRDRGLTADEQDAFLQWLAEDPRHGEWFALHRRTVGDFNCLAQWRPEHGGEPNPDLLARPGRRRWLVPATLAAAGLAIVAGWWQFAPDSRDESEASLVAAQERRILEDGSAIELNRGAVVQAAFTPEERRVTLVQGEALFTVTSNPARPFIVQAGGVAVRAVGTSFNVRLEAAAVEVLVTEGKVEVRPPVDSSADGQSPPSAASAIEPAPAAPLVGAGQRAVVSLTRRAPPEVAPVTREETARLLAWQPRLLDFSSAPLGRAIEEFNRRNRVRFIVADPELAAMPIVASVRSDNVAGFTRILEGTPGIEIERRSESEIVIRRPR